MTAIGLSLGLGIGAMSSGGWMNSPAYAAADSADSLVKFPGMITDFRAGRNAITTVASGSISAASAASLRASSAAFTDCFTFTRSSVKKVINASGVYEDAAIDAPGYDWTNGKRQLLLEGAATNLFLNSAIGGTQSITVTAVAHTLSFYGTGSITLSGTATGSASGTGATVRTSLTFTPTAGSATFTVSGSCTNVQLETSSPATSYIATAGASVTRAADSCLLSSKALALIARTAAGIAVRGQGWSNGQGGGSYALVGGAASHVVGTTVPPTVYFMGTAAVPIFYGTYSPPTIATGIAAGWSGAGKSASANGSVITTNGTALDTTFSSAYLGRRSDGLHVNGWYDELVIYPFRPTDAALVAKAVAYT